jgi:dCTP deaminase
MKAYKKEDCMSGILVREQVVKRIKEQNMVENYDLEKCASPASYELRVGSYLDKRLDQRVNLVDSKVGEIAIMPSGFLLVGTMERVNLPNDIVGMLYLRSTYGRRGFISYFQGLVDPGYRGSLTIMLHNLSGESLTITGGERICHLVFEELPQAAAKGYEGAYQNSEGPTPSRYPSVVKVVGETPKNSSR